MNKFIYVCPASGGKLNLNSEVEKNDVIEQGYFQSDFGFKYTITNGVPDFTFPKILGAIQNQQYDYYENNAESYDDIQSLTFDIHKEDESKIRNKMVSYLELTPDSKVLELCCGTGRDSIIIASLLCKNGELFVQDLSGSMLRQCMKKLKNVTVPVNFSIGNASHLAFPSNYFDAVYSFGGLNVFDDIERGLKEMARVTKPGGKIVVGDESMPEWLYETEFGKILSNANPLFKFKVPFSSIPVEARNVIVRWIIGGVYYLISFSVDVGEPVGNFDIEIPGRRGGTLNTRYYGQLEGVSVETKKKVLEAASKSGKSINNWLEEVLNSATEKVAIEC